MPVVLRPKPHFFVFQKMPIVLRPKPNVVVYLCMTSDLLPTVQKKKKNRVTASTQQEISPFLPNR